MSVIPVINMDLDDDSAVCLGCSVFTREIGSFYCKGCNDKAKGKSVSVNVNIIGSFIYLKEPDSKLVNLLTKEFSYEIKDAFWIKRAMMKKGIMGYKPVKKFFDVKHNRLPIGFLSRLKLFLKDFGYDIIIEDKRNKLRNYEMPVKLLNKTLRDYQLKAVEYVKSDPITFLQLPTGSGKTTIAAEIIRRNVGLTLFVVDRNILLTQTVKEFQEMLGQEIGVITEGDIKLRVVNVATIQTLNMLIKKKDVDLLKFLCNVKVFIIDEAHISASDSYMRVSKHMINATVRVGLSATFKREDGKQMDIESCVGQPVFKIEATDMIERGYIMKPEILFYKYSTVDMNGDFMSRNYNEVYDNKIMCGVNRNKLIHQIIKKFVGFNILVIVNKIEHGKLFNEMIPSSVFIHGDVKKDEREKWLTEMKEKRGKVIIGTASIISKGLDLPSLDVMINATGNLSAITTIQSLGRVLRNHDDKHKAYYIDFFDRGDFFREHTNRRIKTLEEQGHTVQVIENE